MGVSLNDVLCKAEMLSVPTRTAARWGIRPGLAGPVEKILNVSLEQCESIVTERFRLRICNTAVPSLSGNLSLHEALEGRIQQYGTAEDCLARHAFF